MDEPVFKDGFRNDAEPFGHGHEHHELCLHIRREPWICQGLYINARYVVRAANRNA